MVDAPVQRVVKPKLDHLGKGKGKVMVQDVVDTICLYDSDSEYDRAAIAEAERVERTIKIEAQAIPNGAGPSVPFVITTPSPVRAPPQPAPVRVRPVYAPQQVAAPVEPAPAPQQVAQPVSQAGAMVVWAPQPQRVGAPGDELMRAIIASRRTVAANERQAAPHAAAPERRGAPRRRHSQHGICVAGH